MTAPVTIRYRPAGLLAGDDLRLAFEVEAGPVGQLSVTSSTSTSSTAI